MVIVNFGSIRKRTCNRFNKLLTCTLVLEIHSYLKVGKKSLMAFLLYIKYDRRCNIFPTKCPGHEADINTSLIAATEDKILSPSQKT